MLRHWLFIIFIFIFISCETRDYKEVSSATRLSTDQTTDISSVTFSGIDSTSSVTDISVTLNWTVVSGVRSYFINMSVGTNDILQRIATVSSSTSSFTVSELESNTSYTFTVTAQDDTGMAVENDNRFSITTSSMPPAPTLVLKNSPSFDIDIDPLPSFIIYETRLGDTVKLFSDACVTQVGEKVATDSYTVVSVDSSNPLSAGSYNFYAKIENQNGVSSNCSAVFDSYTVLTCPSGYIEVPVNLGMGNQAFCVMAYEAKAWQDSDSDGIVDTNEADDDGCNETACSTENWGVNTYRPGSGEDGFPWRMLDQRNAKRECQSLGDNYDLISNFEWMVIAREVEETAGNWSSGTKGVGCLNRGNVGVDDKCSYDNFGIDGDSGRTLPHTHSLSNGEVIYDFSGNAAEWVDLGTEDDITLAPLTCDQQWQDITQVDDHCGGLLQDDEFKPSNAGLLTFETYENVYKMALDTNGALYLNTDGGMSITANSGVSFKNYTALNGLSTNDLTGALFVDPDEDIYIGTAKGLHISTNGGETFNHLTTANGLGSDIVHDVYVNDDGVTKTIFAATQAGLSLSTDGGTTFSNLTTAQGLGDDTCYSVYLDKNDNIYVGTLNGMSISTDGGTSFDTINSAGNSLAGGVAWTAANRVEDVFVDDKGYLYAATSNGLAFSSDAGVNFTLVDTSDGLGSNRVNAVYVDDNDTSDTEDDVIYVATETGLAISKDKGATFNNRLTLDGLIDNTVFDVIVDSNDIVYAATESGLSISTDNGGSFTTDKDSTDGLGGETMIGYGQVFGGIGEATFRGGSYRSGNYSGIYMMSFEAYPEQPFADTGFRCVYRPQK